MQPDMMSGLGRPRHGFSASGSEAVFYGIGAGPAILPKGRP